jgi:hypothetical protein
LAGCRELLTGVGKWLRVFLSGMQDDDPDYFVIAAQGFRGFSSLDARNSKTLPGPLS